MTSQVNSSLPTIQASIPEGRSSSGPDATGYPACRNFGMGTGGGQAPFRQNQMRKVPVIQPLSKSRDRKALVSSIIAGGSPNRAKDDLQNGVCGRRFLFDKKCTRLERTITVIPPLPRDYHVHRHGNLHPFSLSKELAHSRGRRPFPLGYPDRYELNTSSGILFPSTLVLNGRNTFSVENRMLSRPKVNYPTYNPLTVKDNQKSQCYPDPMVGASHSFLHRISELFSLEGKTVRQEKLKVIRKPRKPPS